MHLKTWAQSYSDAETICVGLGVAPRSRGFAGHYCLNRYQPKSQFADPIFSQSIMLYEIQNVATALDGIR